jgi:hypothetical protein
MNPVSLYELSVHERFICVIDTPAADRSPGAVGTLSANGIVRVPVELQVVRKTTNPIIPLRGAKYLTERVRLLIYKL